MILLMAASGRSSSTVPAGPRRTGVRTAPAKGCLWLSAILLAALSLRLAYLYQLARSPYYDRLVLDLASYDSWAQRIARGDWLGSSVFYQDPLYPYFLAAIYAVAGHRLLVVYLLQALLGTATCLAIYAIGRRLFSERAGLAAAALAAAYKPFIFYDIQIEKSFLAVLLVAAGCWLLIAALARGRAPLLLAAGLVLGLSALIRGNYLLLLSMAALGIVAVPGGAPLDTPARRVRGAAWLLAGAAIIVGATAVRNYAVGGDLVLTTSQAGQNFFIGNNPENLTGMYRAPDFVRPDPKYEEVDFAREAERLAGRSLRPSEVSSFWFARARSFIAERPADFASLLVRKAALFWNDYEIPDNLDLHLLERHAPILRLPLVGFGAAAALGAAGMWMARRGWRTLWPLYLFAFGYFASVVFFYVFSRYRLPVVPFLLVFGGEAATRIYDALRLRVLRPAAAAAAVAAGAWVATRLPLVEPYNPPALVNLGAVLMDMGEAAEAERLFREVLSRRPDYPDAHNNLGVLLLRRGELDAAEERFRSAIALRPRQANGYVNLGLALARQGKLQEGLETLEQAHRLAPRSAEVLAARARLRGDAGDRGAAVADLREAVRVDPGRAELHNNLGTALLAAGDAAGAAAAFREAAALRPGFAEALFNEGVALERLRQEDEAIGAYRRAIAARPDYPEPHGNLAALLAERGDRAGAAAEYGAFLRYWRGDARTRAAVEDELRRLR